MISSPRSGLLWFGGCLLLAACAGPSSERPRAVDSTADAAADAAADSAGASADEPHVTPVVVASVVPVRTMRFDETLDGVGIIVGRAGRVAKLAAPAPTRVMRIGATAGQAVAAGAALVELDLAPFDAAKVGAERALDVAEKALARARRLADAGVLPRKDADVAAADLAAAQAAAVTARRARELAVLRAPFAGVVTRQLAVLGASVDPGQALVEVVDPSAQDWLLTVSPSDAARLHIGSAVRLFTAAKVGERGIAAAGDSVADPVGTPVANGRVSSIGAAIDSASGGVAIRVEVVTHARALRFGEMLIGRVVVGTHPDALVVPADALVPSGEGYRVFVVDGLGVAHATDVEVGGRTSTAVWIRAGLSAGMRVVGHGAYGMDDGAKVAPVAR